LRWLSPDSFSRILPEFLEALPCAGPCALARLAPVGRMGV
jgi:hypothetical protein